MDVTAFADLAERFIVGIEQSGQFTISGHYDSEAGGPDLTLGTLVGGSSTGTFYPAGTASGSRRFSFDFLCLSYRSPLGVKDRVPFEATFQVNSVVAKAVV